MDINKLSEEEVLLKLGQRIIELRQEKNLRQIDLAIKLGIEDSSLIRIETGKTNPTTKTLLKICKELEVSIGELFSFS